MGGLYTKNLVLLQIKGRIESYVGREKEPLSKLTKYIKTMCIKYQITDQELKQILKEVESEIVKPFLKYSGGLLYQPERLDRFKKLCQELEIVID